MSGAITENPHPENPAHKHQGTCEHCGHPFSYRKACNPPKRFGSYECYFSSDKFKSNIKNAHKATRERGNKVVCTCGCGEEFHRPPSKAKRNNGKAFYSTHCKRKYFNERFDRFVATDATFSDVTGYDEFLSQNELPCLVEGCHWSGKNLSTHMNHAHGLTAAQFKERCGFNVRTGVIGANYRLHLQNSGTKHLPKTGPRHAPRGANKGFKFRREGIEHHRKSRALMKVESEASE